VPLQNRMKTRRQECLKLPKPNDSDTLFFTRS
jgi:hypothetical protein